MKKLFITAVLLTSTMTQFAYGKIIDPNNIMGKVDSYIGPLQFEDAFVAGDSHELTLRSCTYTNGQEESCIEEITEARVQAVTAKNVVFEDGNLMPKAIYNHYNGSLFKLMIELMDSEPSSNLISRFSALSSLKGNKSIKLVSSKTVYDYFGLESLEISLEFTGENFTLPLYMRVNKHLPWMAQVTEMGLGTSAGTNPYRPFYEITGWTKLSK